MDFLARAHKLFPRAKWVLLVDRDYTGASPAVRALGLGRADFYIVRPWGDDELSGRDLRGQPGVEWECDREPLPLETSMPGVFAAGDVRRGALKRVAAAVGEGATVVRLLHDLLGEAAVERSHAA